MSFCQEQRWFNSLYVLTRKFHGGFQIVLCFLE